MLSVFSMSPVGAWALTRGLACRQNASMHGMGGLISAPAGLRWAVDGSQTTRTTSELSSSSYWYKGLLSLCLLACSKAEKAGGIWNKKKKIRKKEADKKQCYKKGKSEVGIWKLQLGATRLATEAPRHIFLSNTHVILGNKEKCLVGRWSSLLPPYRIEGIKNEYKDTK